MFAQIVGLAGILIGTATDLHHREVPDWVNYTMIAAGLLLAIRASFLTSGFQPLVASLAGLTLCYIVGAVMYYTGQWGGGDAKMIMGLGALLGISSFNWLQSPPLLITFLVFTLFAGAAYGLVWMFYLLVRDHRKVLPVAKDIASNLKIIRYVVLGCATLVAVLSFLLPFPFSALMLLLALFIYSTFYVLVAVKAVERVCFVKEVRVDDLVEGDWVLGEVKKSGKTIIETRAEGISKEDIDKLRASKVEKVKIKEGIPFVPSFLIAFITSLWWVASGSGWPFLS